eukprot:2544931-Rhodomonas_salina.4
MFSAVAALRYQPPHNCSPWHRYQHGVSPGPVTATDAHWRGAAAAPPVAAQARGWGWGWVGEGGRGLRKQVGWLRRLAQPDPKLDQMLSAGIVAPLSQ